MNVLIAIVGIVLITLLAYFMGKKEAKKEQLENYKEDVDEYLKKKDKIESIDRTVYSADDILCGKPLSDHSTTAKAGTEDGYDNT